MRGEAAGGVGAAGDGYTVVQTARLVAAMRWATGRMFETTGAWAAEIAVARDAVAVAAAAQTAVWMSTVSRRLGSHREAFDELQPDSELLADYRPAAAPSGDVDELLGEIAGASLAWAERLAVSLRVLIPQLLRACEEIERVGAPHCDAALIRAAAALRRDLSAHLDAGEALLAGAGAGAKPGHSNIDEFISIALKRMAHLGGIVPRRLLCPG